ncbi:hypothetical protein [Roseateles sp. P5_E7]
MTLLTICRHLGAALTLALGLGLFCPAWAALIDHERAQIVLLPLLQAPRLAVAAPPEERSLRAGDLISIFVSDKATLKFVEKGEPSATLVALDEARYRELSAQGGGRVPEPGLPPVRGHSWKRLGAAKAGIVHLQISQAGEVKWYRFDIGAAPEFKYGRVVKRSDAEQHEALSLTDYDELVLDLPGEAGDGWTVGPAATSGLKLVSLSQAAVHRVSLTLAVARSEGVPAEPSLVVSNGTKQFVFAWRRAAVPLSR